MQNQQVVFSNRSRGISKALDERAREGRPPREVERRR